MERKNDPSGKESQPANQPTIQTSELKLGSGWGLGVGEASGD